MVWPQNIVLCYLALALSRFVVHFITWLWKRECTNCHPCHVKKTSFEPHTASYIIVLSSNVEAAISLYCNSVHSTFPRQQWMAWLCVRAQQASNPNGDKISLFLSRLHNGSGGGGETSTFPHYDWVGIKKPSGNLIAELMGSWPTTVVNDLKLCSLLPTAGRSASFLTTNRLLRIHRAMARQYAEQQNCFSL